jgi:hypothetical protein
LAACGRSISGANEQGLAQARRIAEDPLSEMRAVGLFDDRNRERLPNSLSLPLLGRVIVRNWSLRFDLYIIFRSVAVVLKDCKAN